MRLLTLFLTTLLILTACAPSQRGLPATPQAGSSPGNETDSTPVPVGPTKALTTRATFENSLLAVEWLDRSKGNFLAPLDPATGIALPGYTPISVGQTYFHAFSSDRHTLAFVIFPNENIYDGNLLLIDLSAWKTQTFKLNLYGWVTALAFSPDAKQLAIAHGETTSRLTIVDLEQGVITAQEKAEAFITHLKFTADGESLMLYSPGRQNFATQSTTLGAIPPHILLLEAGDLSLRWSAELKNVREGIFPKDEKTPLDLNQPGNAMYLSPALAFAPDRAALYIVHADSEQLTTVEFSAQTVETVEIQDQLSWFERLLSLDAGIAYAKVADGTSKQAALSPDGKFLYLVGGNHESFQDAQGNWQMRQTPLGVEIIQTSDGSRLMHIETDAADLSLSPDGRFLYLHNWEEAGPWTEVFDTSSRQITVRKKGIYGTPALLINGEPVVVSTYSSSETVHHMGIFQPGSLGLLFEWTGPHYIAWLTPQ